MTKYKFLFTLTACALLQVTSNLFAQEKITVNNGSLSIGANLDNPILIDFSQNKENTLKTTSAAACPTVTVSLPFFDDFVQEDSYFPNCDKWQDDQVVITKNAAYNPRTIGTATFDGLNSAGKPYNQLANPNQANSADTLTSQLIDLSSYTNASNVYLSFFYQPQGLGDRPEIGDSLFLEFKDINGDWHKMQSYEGVNSANFGVNDSPEFTPDMFIIENDFLHSEFQFRFRNIGSINGNNDNWHIDYVYLDANRRDGDFYFTDVAFTDVPVSPLKRYSAMPWNHFRDSMLNDTLVMRNWNLSNISGTLDREYTIVNQTNNNIILSTPMPAITYSPSPNANDLTTGGFINSLNSFTPTDSCTLLSTYTILNPTDFQNNPIFALNDTVKKETRLHNYFAYDDGTAESRIIAERIGTKVAVEFKTTVEDTLRGIYFHLPYYLNRNAENDYINVKVWLANKDTEVFSRDIYRLRYSDYRNGFHYVELTDFEGNPTPVYLPENMNFYIGWEQASTVSVPVGFDRNNDASQYTYVYTGAGWENVELNGAIMIRPFLSLSGNDNPVGIDHISEVEANKASFKLYPNPTSSYQILNMEWLLNNENPSYIAVYNTLGQCVHQANISSFEQGETLQIELPKLTTGMYFVRVSSTTNKTYAQALKIIE